MVANAHLLRPPQDVKKDFMRLIAPNVCASQGTTVVLIKKSLASPKKFLQPKNVILWAKYVRFM